MAKQKRISKQEMPGNHAVSDVWVDWAPCVTSCDPLLQGSELSGWTTGHFTDSGYDIFQNFPDLNDILWDAEDRGMVPKLTPNHHVPIPESYEFNTSVRRKMTSLLLEPLVCSVFDRWLTGVISLLSV